MLNQLILVGRLTKKPELVKGENGSSYGTITLAIPRSFKNSDGEYDTDFINCRMFNSVAQNTQEYCDKGDIVGVKGRLQSDTIDNEDGTKQFEINVIAEKVTFLSSHKSNE